MNLKERIFCYIYYWSTMYFNEKGFRSTYVTSIAQAIAMTTSSIWVLVASLFRLPQYNEDLFFIIYMAILFISVTGGMFILDKKLTLDRISTDIYPQIECYGDEKIRKVGRSMKWFFMLYSIGMFCISVLYLIKVCFQYESQI